jgi:hypothetical protein
MSVVTRTSFLGVPGAWPTHGGAGYQLTQYAAAPNLLARYCPQIGHLLSQYCQAFTYVFQNIIHYLRDVAAPASTITHLCSCQLTNEVLETSFPDVS